MKLCGFEVGVDRPLFLIAGPCVIESEALCLDIAFRMKEITEKLGIPYIFKASFDKAVRPPRASAGSGSKRASPSSRRSVRRSAFRC